MDIIIKQEALVDHKFNCGEIMVYSLLGTYGDKMPLQMIIDNLIIMEGLFVCHAIDSLLHRGFIVKVESGAIDYYKIIK